MHELAITEGIMEAAIPAARKSGAKKILEIRLKVGEMSGIIPSCVRDYFAMLSKGTIAEGAEILVEYIPVTLVCADCGYSGPADRKVHGCPVCKSRSIRVTGGKEYYVEDLKVE